MVLDTNILIAYLGEDAKVVHAIQEWFSQHVSLFISAVSYAEVLALPEASAADLAKIREFLGYFVIVDVDKDLAESIATIRRASKLKFADAAIAATALRSHSALVTRDKQFRKVNEIQVLSL